MPFIILASQRSQLCCIGQQTSGTLILPWVAGYASVYTEPSLASPVCTSEITIAASHFWQIQEKLKNKKAKTLKIMK